VPPHTPRSAGSSHGRASRSSWDRGRPLRGSATCTSLDLRGKCRRPCFERAPSLARLPVRPERSAYGLAGLRSSRAVKARAVSASQKSAIQTKVPRAGKDAVYQETLQRDRKEYPDFESHRKNLLASDSQKKQSFSSERNCGISVLSHQRGSPQLLAISYVLATIGGKNLHSDSSCLRQPAEPGRASSWVNADKGDLSLPQLFFESVKAGVPGISNPSSKNGAPDGRRAGSAEQFLGDEVIALTRMPILYQRDRSRLTDIANVNQCNPCIAEGVGYAPGEACVEVQKQVFYIA
jgi:hypothetical protein